MGLQANTCCTEQLQMLLAAACVPACVGGSCESQAITDPLYAAQLLSSNCLWLGAHGAFGGGIPFAQLGTTIQQVFCIWPWFWGIQAFRLCTIVMQKRWTFLMICRTTTRSIKLPCLQQPHHLVGTTCTLQASSCWVNRSGAANFTLTSLTRGT